MPNLRDSFDALRHDLDATQAPDMLADAFHRAPSMGGPEGPSAWRRAGIIALALVITIASTVFVVRAFDRDQAGPAAKTGVLPFPLAYTGADAFDPDWTHGHLWLMDEAGQRTALAPITDQTAVPAWSPDGSQIAFAAELDDSGTQIWLINADGTDLHELTRMVPFDGTAVGSAINDSPAWSPDGTKIAFNCYNGQGHQLCVTNADGSGNPRFVSEHSINVAHDTPPVWLGPNELMFSTSGPPAEGTYTVSLGKGEPTRIGTARLQMTISPSRDRIAFLCPTEHGYAICTEGTDLTGREQVTSPPMDLTAAITDSDSFPAWLPDGRLSFVRESRVFDGFHLYVVDAHGGAPTELANLGNDVRGFGWGPSESQVETPSPSPQTTDSPSPAPPPGMSVYADPLGWTAVYPSDWSVTTLQQTSDGLGASVTIANRSSGEKIPVDDVVALTVTHPLGATPDPSAGSSSFPLSADDFTVSPGPSNASLLQFKIDGVSYLATLGAGAAARSSDLATMDEVIASIRPSAATSPQTATVPSTAHELDHPASELAAAGGYIWAAEDVNNTIQKVDPTTGEVVSTIHLDGYASWLAGGTAELWVAVVASDDSAWIVGIDPATDETMVTIPGATGPMVQTDEGLWAFQDRSSQPGWMVLVDPGTGDVIRHVEVPAQPFEAAASGSAVWFLDFHTGEVLLATQAGGETAQVVTNRSSGTFLAGSPSGVYLGAWRLPHSANDQNGPGTSAFASLDGQVQPFGDIYNFRPMVVEGDRVWFVAGPHDGDLSGLCGMRTVDGVVDRCADIPVGLEGVHHPVAFEPVSGTLWATAYDTPTIYEVNSG